MKNFHPHLIFLPVGGKIFKKLKIALTLWVHKILLALKEVTHAYKLYSKFHSKSCDSGDVLQS